jgi:CheY-like chemotaxis protein
LESSQAEGTYQWRLGAYGGGVYLTWEEFAGTGTFNMSVHQFTLADDDPDMLFLLHRKLSQEYPQAKISTFTEGEEALAHIEDTGTEILITDHGMGAMSGTELVRTLRQRGIQYRSSWCRGLQSRRRRRWRREQANFWISM